MNKKNYQDCTVKELTNELIRLRNIARWEGNYVFADKIRKFLNEHGIEVEDLKDETVWHWK